MFFLYGRDIHHTFFGIINKKSLYSVALRHQGIFIVILPVFLFITVILEPLGSRISERSSAHYRTEVRRSSV